MHDSFEGLRSMIGRNWTAHLEPFHETALVESCKNPDQFGRSCSKVEKNRLVCHRKSHVANVDVELHHDVMREIGSNLNFAIPIREAYW